MGFKSLFSKKPSKPISPPSSIKEKPSLPTVTLSSADDTSPPVTIHSSDDEEPRSRPQSSAGDRPGARPSAPRAVSYHSTYSRRTPSRPNLTRRHTSESARSRGASPAPMRRPLRIQVPLYIYPLPTAWHPLYAALLAHPRLHFDIIVNPFNGPGAGDLPDEAYIQALTRLRQHPNVRVYGYVHVNWCERSIEDVLDDVRKYEGWNQASTSSAAIDIHVDGIFVDEAPWETGRKVDYMKDVWRGINDTLTRGVGVWTNPGCPVAREYYDYADRVTAFEQGYDQWVQRGGLTQGFDGGVKEKRKSSVMVHSCPKENVKAVLQKCREEQVDGCFITECGGYEKWGLDWAEWVKIVADEVDATA